MGACSNRDVSNLSRVVEQEFRGRLAGRFGKLPAAYDEQDLLQEVLLRLMIHMPELVRAWCANGVLVPDERTGELVVADREIWTGLVVKCRGRRSEIVRKILRHPVETAIVAEGEKGAIADPEGREVAPFVRLARRDEVKTLLSQISKAERRVLRCRHLLGRSLKETAFRLRIPIGTAQSHEFRARQKLMAAVALA